MIKFNEPTWKKDKKVKVKSYCFFFSQKKEELQIILRLSLGDQHNKNPIQNKIEKE